MNYVTSSSFVLSIIFQTYLLLPNTHAQVHLLYFTSSGNQFLVEWAIFPADSADYISNTAAMVFLSFIKFNLQVGSCGYRFAPDSSVCMQSIIMRLRDHHVQLPERFGSYQLVEWKIEPQKKRCGFMFLFNIYMFSCD